MKQKIKLSTGKWTGIFGMAAMVFTLCGIFPVSADAKSPSYVLECRGGGGMYASVHKVGSVQIRGFRSARAAASARHPGPGECAWLDRPMRRDEPKQLWYPRRNSPIESVRVRANATTIGWMDTARYPIITVLKAIQKGKVFLVHVKQVRISHRKVFRIERVGP